MPGFEPPDLPTRSESLYRVSYPGQPQQSVQIEVNTFKLEIHLNNIEHPVPLLYRYFFIRSNNCLMIYRKEWLFILVSHKTHKYTE